MKRTRKLFIIVITLSVLLAGCSSGGSRDMSVKEYSESWSGSEAADADSPAPEEAIEDGSDTASLTANSGGEIVPDKMIFTADATVETLDFDHCVEQVNSMVNEYGGFIENSSVTGISTYSTYYDYTPNRTAAYTIRIPYDKFSGLGDTLKNIGNVIEYKTQVKNVTREYTDLETRLATYETQQERLLSMLEQAESIEDMLSIEERLTQVIYNIESLTTSINGLNTQINYSTLNLYIEEVEKITEKTERAGYWEDVAATLGTSLAGTAAFFKAFLKYLIAALPVIVIILAAAVVVFLIRRKQRQKRKSDITLEDEAQQTYKTSEADENKEGE